MIISIIEAIMGLDVAVSKNNIMHNLYQIYLPQIYFSLIHDNFYSILFH